MFRNIFAFVLSCFVVFLIGCGEEKKPLDEIIAFERFPLSNYHRLQEECDLVDIVFFDSPVSMSQDEPNAIKGTLNFFTPGSAVHNPECKPKGRITYSIKGEIFAEGDFYCSGGCTYIIFMEDDKPKYANMLSIGGVQFFQNFADKVQEQMLPPQ